MRKLKIVPVLFLSLSALLVSCGNTESSSPSSDDSSSPDIDPKNDYVAEDSKEGLVTTLLKLKNERNFSATSDYDKSNFSFTNQFFINEKQNIAYVNLPSHKDNTKKLAYQVKYLKNGDPYPASMGYSVDAYGNRSELTFDDFNFLHYLSGDLAVTSFSSDGTAYLTEDEGVVSSFNEFYGTSSIGKVSFWFDEGNRRLNYEVFDTSSTSLSTGSFYHISNTRNKKFEQLVDNFSWETDGKALNESQASTLFDEDFSCTTDIKRIGAIEGTKRIASIDFSCTSDKIYIHSVDNPDQNPSDFYTYLTKREKDGRAISHGLNSQNQETEEETRYFFEQWPVPHNLDINDFRLCADGNYRYFSIEPNLVYQTLAHVSINDENCSFEEAILKMDNGKVVGVIMNSTANLIYRYQAVSTLKAYEKIELPTAYTEEGPREIKQAMTYFDGSSAFKIVKANRENIANATRKITYTFDGTTYLIQEESYDSSKQIWNSNVYGYTVKDDGNVLPFRRIKGSNRLVQSDDVVPNDTIVNHFPSMIDAKTIRSLGGGVYSFRELITDSLSSLWISANAIPSTVKMNVSGGKIISMLYGVNYSVDDGEYLTFSYDDIALPQEIDVNNIGPMELTCYADDSPDEWQDLVNYIGEENALLIPYFYEKQNVGNWYAEPRYSSGTGVPDKNEDGQIDYDSPLIGVGLYLASSNTATSVLDQGFIDNGFTKIESGSIDVGYRDDDYKQNGRNSDVYLVDASKQTVWEKTLDEGKKLRVVYDNDIAFYHFNPNIQTSCTLGSGLFIQLLDASNNVIINRNGEFH